MKKHKSNSPQKIIVKKQISFTKNLNFYTSLFFVALICLNFLGLLYSIDTISSLKNDILNLDERIEKIENNNAYLNLENSDENINNYYRELSSKTDEAIGRILTIVGLLATVTTFFGILLAFKAPKDIEKKIEENKALLSKAEKVSEEAKYQAEIIEALNIDYDGELTNPKRIQQISKIIKEYPEKANAYMHRAFLYDKMAQKSSGFKQKEFLYLSISDYEIAHKLDVDISSYYNDMGVAYSRLHEYHKAIAYYTKAIKKDPDDTAAYTNRGGDYESIGEYQKSLDDFEKALKIDSDCYSAYLSRSYTYQSLWRKEENPEQRDNYIKLQIADLERAIEINPEDNLPKKLLKRLIIELSEKQLVNKFGFYGTQEEIINMIIAKIDERIGDLQKEEKEYTEAFKQYIDAILPYGNRYLFHRDVNAKTELIRIISKLYDVNSNNIDTKKGDTEVAINKFCQIMRTLAPLLYIDGEKDGAEKLSALLLNYDDNDKNAALNLAFMKRRCETNYIEKSAIELLDLCSDQKSVIWCMNKALCYIDGVGVDVNWHKAIEVLDNSETDIISAVDWWSQIDLVGEKENNIVFLLFALSTKHNVTDSHSLEQRITKAKEDGYKIPDDLCS